MIPLINALLAAFTTGIAVWEPTPFHIGCAVFCGLCFVVSIAMELR